MRSDSIVGDQRVLLSTGRYIKAEVIRALALSMILIDGRRAVTAVRQANFAINFQFRNKEAIHNVQYTLEACNT